MMPVTPAMPALPNATQADDDEIDRQESPGVDPLVNWPKPPTLMELKQDLMDAKPLHDTQITKINTWLDNLHLTGTAKFKAPRGRSGIQPKLIRKQAEWRYAPLSEPFLSTDDLFNVRPVTWEDRDAARQNQLVLNHQFNKYIDKVNFIDEYVRTAVDEGTVILRVSWCFEEELVSERVPKVEYRANLSLAPLMEQLTAMEQESPSQYATDVPEELKKAHQLSVAHGIPYEPKIIGHEQKTRMKTVKNHPVLEICDARNVVIDPSCRGNLKKAGFVIYSFESSLSELRKDKRYRNLHLIEPNNNSPLAEPDHAASTGVSNFNFADTARKKFVVHEYWGFRDIDGSGKVVPIVAAWVGNVMIRLEKNPYPDKEIPFITARYLPVRKSVYGEPDGELLEDNQKVVGAVTRGMIDLLGRSANGQTGMRKDMLDATNRRKFEAGLDYEFNQNVDPRQGVHMHTYPEIPASAQFMLQMQNMEAESLTGVKAYANGVSGQSLGDVAAAVRGALDAASKRELGILRRLSAGLIEAGRKIIAMNAEFLEDQEVIRITNDQFIQVRRDDLAGNFDLQLSISTAEEDNNKAEQLGFMLQTIGPNMDIGITKMLLADIARLRKMPDLAHKIEQYQPQPDPLVQQEAQLKLMLLQAQIDKERAQAQQLMATAQLQGAKVGTESAKQDNLRSDTEQKDLDFVEQESGVKQERDLQRQGAQARAQTQLKMVEHGLEAAERQKDRETDLLKQYMLKRNN